MHSAFRSFLCTRRTGLYVVFSGKEMFTLIECCRSAYAPAHTTQTRPLLGKRYFVSSFIAPGRTFTRRLWHINKSLADRRCAVSIQPASIPSAGAISTASPRHCNPPPAPGLLRKVADMAAMATALTSRRTYTT